MHFMFRFTGLALLLQAALLLATPRPARAAARRPAVFALSGRIIGHTGLPLPGAIVTVKGTAALATTNSAGAFLLSTEQLNPVLLITCQGYQSQTLAVQVRSTLAITLYPIGVAPPLAVSADASADIVAVVNPSLIIADVQPAYTGGMAAYREYLRQNAHYPDKAKEAGIEGSVFVGFVVDEAGRILDAQVLKGLGYGLDEEALRLVRLMPWWSPGVLNGKPVKVASTLRIRFGVVQP